MKVLVTGASGFLGGAVCRALVEAGLQVSAAVRREVPLPAGVVAHRIADLGPETYWGHALAGTEAVVHLAARAHVMKDEEKDPLAVFRTVNRDGAVALAEQAADAGVRRFVFISSIKAMGESTAPGHAFHPADKPAPVDAYGIAKAEAEERLAALAAHRRMELVVIRPPVVHGPGAKGNLAALMRLIERGWPLPLASVTARRSLVGLDNLADLIRLCVIHPAAPGKTFLVRDDPDPTVPELIRHLARCMGRPARLLPVPPPLLRGLAVLAGRRALASRLLDSLVVDDRDTRATLGWEPPFSLDEGLAAMVKARGRSG